MMFPTLLLLRDFFNFPSFLVTEFSSPSPSLLLSITIYHKQCYHVLNVPITSSLSSRVFCILSFKLLHLLWQKHWNSYSSHRYSQTTTVTMPVLVSCVAQLLPPTLNTHHHQPLQQHCKHSQQTLSVVISAELLLADGELTTLSHWCRHYEQHHISSCFTIITWAWAWAWICM